MICINASRPALIPVVGRIIKKYDFALPIKSEKQKLAEAWYRDRLKIFQNLFESLGFIHIKHTLKQQLINHIDLQNMLASCYLISQIKTAN